jgi:hypothetical protein
MERPSYLNDAPVSKTDETAQAPSLPKMSIKGKRFKLKQGDDVVALGTNADIIILCVTPPENFKNHRQYWKDSYEQDTSTPPNCASPNGVVPYDHIEEPQFDNCDECPRNVPGSDHKSASSKARACKSSKEVLAVLPDALNKPFRLSVPIMSLKALSAHRYDVKTNWQAPIAAVITILGFDDECDDYPKLTFKCGGFLPENIGSQTVQLAASDNIAGMLEGSSQLKIEAPADTRPTERPAPTEPIECPADDIAGTVEDMLFGDMDEPKKLVDELCELIEAAPTRSEFDMACKLRQADIRGLSLPDKVVFKEVYTQMIAKFADPINSLRTAITHCVQSDFPKLATEIVAAQAVPRLKDLFTKAISELNGVEFDPAIHGTSQSGLPALTKDGSFKRRKGQATVETKSPVEEDNEAALADMGLDEI